MITGVISRFATGTYTITRTDPEVPVDGYFMGGDSSTFEIVASVQPEGDKLMIPAEGQRTDDHVVIYTTTALTARSPNGPGDRIAYRGEPYEVVSVQRWEAFGESFVQARAARTVAP